MHLNGFSERMWFQFKPCSKPIERDCFAFIKGRRPQTSERHQSHPQFFTVKTFQRMQSRKLPERTIEAHIVKAVKVWWCWMCDGHVILNPLHHAFHLSAWTISFLFRWFPGSWQNAGRTNCGHVSSIATPREDLGTTNLSRCNCRFVSA